MPAAGDSLPENVVLPTEKDDVQAKQALRGDKEARHRIRTELDRILLAGNTGAAMQYLKEIAPENIKNQKRLDEAVKYRGNFKTIIGTGFAWHPNSFAMGFQRTLVRFQSDCSLFGAMLCHCRASFEITSILNGKVPTSVAMPYVPCSRTEIRAIRPRRRMT